MPSHTRQPRGTVLLDRRQVTALASPARLEIVEAMGVLGRVSARELAAHLGRSAGAVYHHVRTLEAAGLLEEVDRRPGPRRPENLYAVTAGRLAVPAGQTASGDRAAVRALHAVLRQASRDVDTAFAGGAAALRGRFHGLQLSAPLSAGERRRVLRALASIEAVFRAATKARRAQADNVLRWTSVLLPVRRRRS